MTRHRRSSFPRVPLAGLLALLVIASSVRADAGWRDFSRQASNGGELTATRDRDDARATDSLRAGTTSTELACEALRNARSRHSLDTTHAPPPARADTASHHSVAPIRLAVSTAGSATLTRASPASPRAPPFAD
ncbi:MAG: hypothetical protein U0610_32080 [bacterium]